MEKVTTFSVLSFIRTDNIELNKLRIEGCHPDSDAA
jgi:hypothetical protein